MSTSIKQALQNLMPVDQGIVEGLVTKAEPLEITLVNDSKVKITKNSLVIPRHLTNYQTQGDVSYGDVTAPTTSVSHTHDGGAHNEHVSGNGTHTHDGGSHTHSLSSFKVIGANISIYNALQLGDEVYMLAFNNGKQYYVLDRKG